MSSSMAFRVQTGPEHVGCRAGRGQKGVKRDRGKGPSRAASKCPVICGRAGAVFLKLILKKTALYTTFPNHHPLRHDMTTPPHPRSQPFQAEVSELLPLMLHSSIPKTDIFLRELIERFRCLQTSCRMRQSPWPELSRTASSRKFRSAGQQDDTIVGPTAGTG